MARMDPVRIAVADDSPLACDALEDGFRADAAFLVVGRAGDADGVLRLVRSSSPDVLLLGFSGATAIELTQALTRWDPPVRVIVVTSDDEPEVLLAALEAGAAGCLTKWATVRDLQRAVKTVSVGGVVLDPFVAAQLIPGGRFRGTRGDMGRRTELARWTDARERTE